MCSPSKCAGSRTQAGRPTASIERRACAGPAGDRGRASAGDVGSGIADLGRALRGEGLHPDRAPETAGNGDREGQARPACGGRCADSQAQTLRVHASASARSG